MSNFVGEFHDQCRSLDDLGERLWPLIQAFRAVGNDKVADELVAHAVALSKTVDALGRLVDQRLAEDLKQAQAGSAALLKAIMIGTISTPKDEMPSPPQASRHTLTELLRLAREGDRGATIRVAQSMTNASLVETTEMVNAVWESRLDERLNDETPSPRSTVPEGSQGSDDGVWTVSDGDWKGRTT